MIDDLVTSGLQPLPVPAQQSLTSPLAATGNRASTSRRCSEKEPLEAQGLRQFSSNRVTRMKGREYVDAAGGGQQLANHTQPEREPEIQPDRMADDFPNYPVRRLTAILAADVAGYSRLIGVA